ncbi:MAG: hypothetical protein QM487_14280 [Candidatus Marithrix sp.]
MIGVSVILLAAAVLGNLGMYNAQAVQANTNDNTDIRIDKIEVDFKDEIKEVGKNHDKDINLIYKSLDRIEEGQKTITADIKELLRNK